MKGVVLLVFTTVFSVEAQPLESYEVCAGKESFTFNFEGKFDVGTNSWHFQSKDRNKEEIRIAYYSNGEFHSDLSDATRLTLAENGSVAITLHSLTREDSGTYRKHGLKQSIELNVKDPCLTQVECNKDDCIKLKCATATKTNVFIWEVDGNVIEGETSSAIEQCLDDQFQGNKTFKCMLQGQNGSYDQLSVMFHTKSSALSTGAIIGIIVSLVFILVAAIILIIKCRGSKGWYIKLRKRSHS